MAQFRQSGMERAGARNGFSDQVSIGIHAPLHKQSRSRRSSKARRISFRYVLLLSVAVSLLVIVFLARDHLGEVDSYNHFQDKGIYNGTDFLSTFSLPKNKILMFGHSSIAHGRDSRYWDKDDRRRDVDYNENTVEHSSRAAVDGKAGKGHDTDVNHGNEKFTFNWTLLNNEGEHDNVKKYDTSVRYNDHPEEELHEQKLPGQIRADASDDYDDGFDYHDVMEESYNGTHVNVHSDIKNHIRKVHRRSSNVFGSKGSDRNSAEIVNLGKGDSSQKFENKVVGDENTEQIASHHHSTRKVDFEKLFGLKKKPKHHKFSGTCEMKLLNSTSQLVEPLKSKKFARFVLRYTNTEEKPEGAGYWEPKFAGHQGLEQRERSFLAVGNTINCGFVRSPEGSTGFDLAVDDKKYINSCRIAVISCIFGNSDRLRSPMGKLVSQASRKSVCFVMFTDEISLKTLSSEGQAPDGMGFIGLWRVVVVKNLPYNDMRRVGKIPKLLAHRLFTSARYSIWLDSKLRLQLDPLLVLEYLLWRRGYEFAISNHYDRHCLWEEVAQNKKLNKYNHTIIDQQFEFYQADGMKRFNSSDPNKLLPSNVPEGSFIVRAHTPMSNLFSCLWFNEVERFTTRDQLSFAYTYQKLVRMNPMKPFYLNMFKDCERRTIAKLFHHRADEKRRVPAKVTD